MNAPTPVVVTGVGTVNALAGDAPAFAKALRDGRCGIGLAAPFGETQGQWVAAPLAGFDWREAIGRHEGSLPECVTRARKVLRNNTPSARLSAAAAFEAVRQARLVQDGFAPERIGIVVAGSNLHQQLAWDGARRREAGGTVDPRYGLSFLDSGQVGSLGEIFCLRGLGYSVGAASASGQMAIFQAWHWLRSGVLDACLVVGASMDLSPLELEGFALLGALGGDGYAERPEQACRPFDRDHRGFIWGQGSGALVLERQDLAAARGVPSLGEIRGAAIAMDGNHLPDSSLDGEVRAMRDALAAAGLGAADIDYVNAHGTSTPLGDRTECAALRAVLGQRAAAVWVNSTKSLIGHCLSAAGVIEAIACLLQLNGGFLHPNLNLLAPIDSELRFVGRQAVAGTFSTALSNGFGFGGFNGSLVLGRGQG